MLRSWVKDFIHNSVVHPILPFLPLRWANLVHDRNADWAFGQDRLDEMGIESRMRDGNYVRN